MKERIKTEKVNILDREVAIVYWRTRSIRSGIWYSAKITFGPGLEDVVMVDDNDIEKVQAKAYESARIAIFARQSLAPEDG